MTDSTKKPGPVGYGKPPVEHQWKKGQSGNPKGRRPTEPPDIVRSCIRAVSQRVAVPMNGRSKNSLLDVAMMRMVTDAAKGKTTALREMIRLMNSAQDTPASGWTIIDARPAFENEERRLSEIAAENLRLSEENEALKARLVGVQAQLPPPFSKEE